MPDSTTTTRKRGRPPFKPNDEQREMVRVWIMAGCSQQTIAKAMGINPDTLKKHFSEEIDDGKDFVLGNLASVTYRRAMFEGCVASTFFLLKTRFGYRETNRLELKDDREAIPLEGVDYENMSRADRAALRDVITRNMKADAGGPNAARKTKPTTH